jgi:hypothetical protein
MKHTQGPWQIRQSRSKTHPYGVVATDLDFEHTVCVDEDDARLIAAAPDMLDALRCALADLEGLAESLDEDHPAHQSIAECQAAISKATGDKA